MRSFKTYAGIIQIYDPGDPLPVDPISVFDKQGVIVCYIKTLGEYDGLACLEPVREHTGRKIVGWGKFQGKVALGVS